MEYIALYKIEVFMQTAKVCVLITFKKMLCSLGEKKYNILNYASHVYVIQERQGCYFFLIMRCSLEASKFDS